MKTHGENISYITTIITKIQWKTLCQNLQLLYKLNKLNFIFYIHLNMLFHLSQKFIPIASLVSLKIIVNHLSSVTRSCPIAGTAISHSELINMCFLSLSMITPISTIKIVKDLRVLLEKAAHSLAFTIFKIYFKFTLNFGQVNQCLSFSTCERINIIESIFTISIFSLK